MNLPKALEKEQDAEIKFTEEKNKIYDVDWHTIVNPFVDKNSKTDKSMQATPALLLEDLSSKESLADATNRNKSADETVRANAGE